MKSSKSNENINKIHKKKEKYKCIFSEKDENQNYIIYTNSSYLYSNKDEIHSKHSNYEKIYINKKNNYSNINPDEIGIENRYSKINDDFGDVKDDRNSLTLQISGTKSIKEIKYKKNNNVKDVSSPARRKTPEKKLKDIKRLAKARKFRQRNKNIENNINNEANNTATFNEDKTCDKYNEFTFHKEENNNDKNSINSNLCNFVHIRNLNNEKIGGKINLFELKEKPEIINNNRNHYSIDAENRKKILRLLKLNKMNKINNNRKAKMLDKNKNQSELNLDKLPKHKIKNYNHERTYDKIDKLDKGFLKEIINNKSTKNIIHKRKINKNLSKNKDKKYPIKKNYSFDAPSPSAYKKKIIKKNSYILAKNKKSGFQRMKSDDRFCSTLTLSESNCKNNNNFIYNSNKKSRDNSNNTSFMEQSMKLNYMNNNTPINKKFIYTGGNKNIISNYYNNNFYNTQIRSYVEQSSFYLGYNAKKSRSLNNSIKNIIDKSKIKKYNRIYEKENCINLNLTSSPISMNERFYSNINNQKCNKNRNQYEINSNFIYEYSSPKNKDQSKSIKNYHFSINFEELMIVGEKLYEIVKSMINNKKMANECFEFWNYFYNSELPNGIRDLILNSELKESIYSINYTLMSVLICYDYSFDTNLVEKHFSLLKETLDLIVNNYIIFCKYIIKKVSKKNKNNKWIYKLNNMLSNNNVYSKISINNDNNNEFILNHNSSVEKIIYNTNIIIKNLKIILENFKSNSNESLLILFKKISQKNYEDINYFYRTFLLREENINGSFLASLYLKDNPNFHSVKKPYIMKPANKRYTLILDLEETLLNFRLKSENRGEGALKLRPGLFEFLDTVQIFYEIILFTASSQDYAENLIDNIEEKKKYFEYKFFRQHNIVIENDFVKDLSRIGRDLDKMIIVDNMPQNYRLHKKNGIHIKGFWGEELNDRMLFDLKDILVRIAKEGGDLRIGLEKYHEDIAEKVTSSIYQFNFE